MPRKIQKYPVLDIAARLFAFTVLLASVHGTSSADTFRSLEIQAHKELFRQIEDSQGITDFKTDGCSGGLSSVWRTLSGQFPEFAKTHEAKPPWEACCVAHDRAYHSAGNTKEPLQSYASRLNADEELRTCVTGTWTERSARLKANYDLTDSQIERAYRQIGSAMYDAVRIGGIPCTGLSWRWGYGYPNCSLELDLFDLAD